MVYIRSTKERLKTRMAQVDAVIVVKYQFNVNPAFVKNGLG